MVDQEVLGFMNLEPQEALKPEVDMRDSAIPSLDMTVFRRYRPILVRLEFSLKALVPVGLESSVVCEAAIRFTTLYRLRYWNISVSLPKYEFGKLTIPFLSHEVSVDGIRALPKIVKGIEDLPFPSTYKGVQSSLGSRNYYNKFIEDLPLPLRSTN
ncbi:LOW QUALITY PROTEIN: reverse transcriptase [Phytophthora megakarya]|uniref:Reverse transcriptase n=1 Tax=Phytophthora megakarya TaxID=4795 RepID=A0A225UM07_9STRA|nr:LOW QUALITY PROTEIN: reverse transcriptase [Phytophthora megakarya]